MITTRLPIRRSSKDSEPMVLVFPACLPQAKAKVRAKVRVKVRDAEVKVKGKVKVMVEVKAKERAKVKEEAKEKVKEKAKAKVRVNMSVQVQVQVKVVSSVGLRSTGPKNVPRLGKDQVVPHRGGPNSAGTKRHWVRARMAIANTNTSTKVTLSHV